MKQICEMLRSLSGQSQKSASTSSSGIWDTQLQGKDASWEIESIEDRLLHKVLVFFKRKVICIKSRLNGSRNRSNHSTGSNLSIQVDRVYFLPK